MGISEIVQIVAHIIYWMIVILCSLTILYQKRDPARSLSWIAVIVLLPFAGILLYIFFGQNFRRRWIQARREAREDEYIEKYYDKQIKSINNTDSADGLGRYRQIITLLLNNSRSLLAVDNSLDILDNGKKAIESIFDAIENAKTSINIEFYIIEPDEVGMRLFDLLIKKARSGVKVKVLYDDVGSWKISRKLTRKLKREGIGISCFFPVAFPLLSSRLNNRNHRKIVVVDGEIGFAGGVNIAQRYLSDNWHDTHLRIKGDAVKMLQLTFMTDWFYATKEVVNEWKQGRDVCGTVPIQIAASGPDSTWATIMQAYFEAITKARKSIYISTPYFTPTQPMLTALKVAALGGIDVRLMVPEKGDVRLAHWATRSYFSELLEANVGIYLYSKGFVHTKMICVDREICSIGSVNMDERSFEDNYEITAFIYSDEVAGKVADKFMEECSSCIELSLDQWESRKRKNDMTEAICRLISPLL